jgi:succinoglycan biosynthesis protein ExoO
LERDKLAKPKLAAVICVFNKQDYVARSISSVLRQQPAVDELIVVDDASTDDSVARIEAITDPRLRLLRRTDPLRRGVSEATNLAIGATDADWIAFLDADDGWLENFMPVVAGLIEHAPAEVGCVFTGWEDRWADQDPTQDRYSAQRRDADPVRLDFDAFLEAWLDLGFTPMCGSAVAFRRETLVKAGLFPVGQHRGEDKDLWFRALALADAFGSPQVCAFYDRAVPGQAHKAVTHHRRPWVCTTIEKMIPPSSGRRRVLLKRLFNAEVFRYARHVGLREPISREVYRGFHVAEDPLKYAVLLGLTYTPAFLQSLVRQALLAAKAGRRHAHAQG